MIVIPLNLLITTEWQTLKTPPTPRKASQIQKPSLTADNLLLKDYFPNRITWLHKGVNFPSAIELLRVVGIFFLFVLTPSWLLHWRTMRPCYSVVLRFTQTQQLLMYGEKGWDAKGNRMVPLLLKYLVVPAKVVCGNCTCERIRFFSSWFKSFVCMCVFNMEAVSANTPSVVCVKGCSLWLEPVKMIWGPQFGKIEFGLMVPFQWLDQFGVCLADSVFVVWGEGGVWWQILDS